MTALSDRVRLTQGRLVRQEEIQRCERWSFGDVLGQSPLGIGMADDDLRMLMDQVRQQGYEEGRAETERELSQQWEARMMDFVKSQNRLRAEQLSSLLSQAQTDVHALHGQLAEQVLELVCELGRRVLMTELAGERKASLVAVIEQAVASLLDEAAPITVYLGSQDHAAMQQELMEWLGNRTQVLLDPTLDAGSCRVESAGSLVDGRMQTRWRSAIAGWGQSLPWEGEGVSHG